jgi:hypothetical protein
MDFHAAETLAGDVMKDARVPLHQLYRTIALSGHPDRSKAQIVLEALDELSIMPWLAAAGKLSGTHRIQALFEAHRASKRLEERVVETLRSMLPGHAPLPPPPILQGPVEVEPPVTRECDEAYLLLRRLHRPDEATADAREHDSFWRHTREEERDRLIRLYVDTGEFQ